MNFDFNIFAGQPTLPTIWFVVVGVFWIGYLILDSFDLGVGMLMSRFFAKNEQERRLLLNTIGPVWDGNEVWVVTGGAATFAAFPLWYASLFSALYVPLTLALLALIFRAVAIEYRGKKTTNAGLTGGTPPSQYPHSSSPCWWGRCWRSPQSGCPLTATATAWAVPSPGQAGPYSWAGCHW